MFTGPSHGGNCAYRYRKGVEPRVLDGGFLYWTIWENREIHHTDTLISGTFADNMKTGKWSYRRKSQALFDKEISLCVAYRDGRRYGGYELRIKILGRWSYLRMQFDEDTPKGVVKGNIFGKKLYGYLDAQGMPDGTWTVESVEDYHKKTNVEVWKEGELIQTYSSSGKGGRPMRSTPVALLLIRNFVENESGLLEGRIAQGGSVWNGDIRHKE